RGMARALRASAPRRARPPRSSPFQGEGHGCIRWRTGKRARRGHTGNAVRSRQMADDYLYDVFVSYRHKEPVLDWLRHHFYPKLQRWLPNVMPRDPEIFVDWQIEVGSAWPLTLREGLLRSRCMVAICTPEYFRSPWCLAEWRSFRARERAL